MSSSPPSTTTAVHEIPETFPDVTTTRRPDISVGKFTGKNILSGADVATLWGTLIFTVIVSLVATCTAKKGIRGFFFANRNIGFLPIACSMYMTDVGSAQFVAMAGMASHSGLTVYAYELQSTFALILLGWVFMPVYIASGSVTTLDYLKKRYGGKRIEIYLAALTLLLIVLTKTSVELYAISQLLETVFVNVSYGYLSILPLLWSVILTAAGGLQTVVYTDTAQALILLFGAVYISYYSLANFETYDVLREKYFDAWPNTTRLHFGDNTTYPYTYCGIPKALSWNIIRSYGNQEIPWPGMVFGIAVGSVWYFCCDQMIVQFGLGAKSILHAKSACIVTSYAKILSVMFLIIPGIVARIFYTDVVACADPQVCESICHSRTGCSNLAFPLLFMDVVPPNYRGIVLSAVVSCCVSSMSACLNSASTIFTINIYRNIKARPTELELLFVSKSAILAISVLSLCWVPIVRMMPIVMDYIQAFISILAPPIAAVFLCGLLWDRASEKAAFQSLMLGLTLSLIRLAWSYYYGIVACGEEVKSQVPDIIAHYHYLHFSIFLFVLCSVYIIISGIFSEPINVVHLYRLVYWLRLSKLDRVDLSEMEQVFKKIEEDEQPAVTPDIAEQPEKQKNSKLTSVVCCVEQEMENPYITNNELREIVKLNANIDESNRYARTLNSHAILVMLITAFLWGYFS
ncbi:sodium/glucose cotransporter 1-like [Physella acuta]|uniref:sodium/glucose cotransporter 1-like n=1 Tax=Physella acuta TaxID=109671 RepID=UPI0027DB1B88|nr:sodium/glucose cotransporter 1-like [Physella acuta]